MDAWVIWLLVALGLCVAELVTAQFFAVFFAGGAAAAAVAAAAGASEVPQFAIFLVVSLASVGLIRPLVRRTQAGPSPAFGAARLPGREAVVLAAVAGEDRPGTVRLDGDVWTARSSDGTEIPAGARVTVVRIDGAIAVVEEGG